MLLLEDRRFYTYIYLNPLKPGTFIYEDHCFAFQPFYVGKGCNARMFGHLREAKRFSKEGCPVGGNRHKIRLINKIKRELGCDPVILKIKSNLTSFEACDLEKHLIKLIGRSDKHLGPLTNLTDGGDGLLGLSEESKDKMRSTKLSFSEEKKEAIQLKIKQHYIDNPDKKSEAMAKRKETYRKNPDIKVRELQNRKKTYEMNPNLAIERGKKVSNTKRQNPEKYSESARRAAVTVRNDPEKYKDRVDRNRKNNTDPAILEKKRTTRQNTDRINPEIRKNSSIKAAKTRRDHPEIEERRKTNFLKTLKENPEIIINGTHKSKETKIKNRSEVGTDNPSYFEFDFTFIINLYFLETDFIKMRALYKEKYDVSIGRTAYDRFLNILKFPFNTYVSSRRNPYKNIDIYRGFISSHKHLQQ